MTLKTTVIRSQFAGLTAELDRPEISILLGPRQVGKTHLLKELKAFAESQGKQTRYYNLESPADLFIFHQSNLDLFNLLTQSPAVIFIDEFHYLPNASQLFKAIFDTHPEIKLVVSGSSSIEIHKHLKESLAGRRLITRIGPLSFQEYSQAFPSESPQKILSRYLTFGGLPGLLHEADDAGKIRLLNEMVETYLQKDIKSLIKEENLRAFNALLFLIAQNQGQLVSIHSLANEINMTSASVERYLSILEATYILYPLHSYAKNIGNELKKSKKYYLYDLGIRNALLKDFRPEDRPDIGAIYETYIHNRWKLILAPNQDLFFWRTRQGQEMDLVLIENRIPYIMEIKRSAATIPKAFTTFFAHYPECTNGTIYSTTSGPDVQIEHGSIQFRSFTDPL